MKDVVLIFGYNNTRRYDIERLKFMCRDMLNADILLCKDEISTQDQNITPFTLSIELEIHSLAKIKKSIEEIDRYLVAQALNPIACLPFSDKGIPLGSYYAASKGLKHDDSEKSFACADKYRFRELEAKTETPNWYKKPLFKQVYSYHEARQIVATSTVSLFFKPTAEGNSRGCIAINDLTDLIKNRTMLEPYFSSGVIIEEHIKDCHEYSFDGVDGFYIITEKETSTGNYRVETQHVLPAPLSATAYSRLIEAGKIVSNIVGSNGGAEHNELFLDKHSEHVYCVEPNRRPAGLKLWDWIAVAYPEIDNWRAWLNWAGGNSNKTTYPTQNTYYVGCRMLQAKQSGILKKISADVPRNFKQFIVEIVISKPLGSTVTHELKENGDFVGYVVCKHRDCKELKSMLCVIENHIQSTMVIE